MMQLKLLFANWTQAAGLLLTGAALAWAIKLSVIIATNGQVINTGAAALFMKIGLVLFLVGSTGIGNRLAHKRSAWLRILAILLSPALVFGSFLLFGAILAPVVQYIPLWYAGQEAAIGMAVLVYGPVGYLLYRSRRPIARNLIHARA